MTACNNFNQIISVNLDDDYMDDFSDDELDENYEKDILGDGK